MVDPNTRIKMLRIRSWRRGMKEMDLLLGPYADKALAGLPEDQVDAFETMLNENDQDLYAWFTGRVETPENVAPALERVRQFHGVDIPA
jgi:antitoxin CptB